MDADTWVLGLSDSYTENSTGVEIQWVQEMKFYPGLWREGNKEKSEKGREEKEKHWGRAGELGNRVFITALRQVT